MTTSIQTIEIVALSFIARQIDRCSWLTKQHSRNWHVDGGDSLHSNQGV
jgi:hypothetical protein